MELHREWLRFVAFYVALGHRKGQAWMNALGAVAPDLYEIVTGTDADCFHNDAKCAKFNETVWGF